MTSLATSYHYSFIRSTSRIHLTPGIHHLSTTPSTSSSPLHRQIPLRRFIYLRHLHPSTLVDSHHSHLIVVPPFTNLLKELAHKLR